MLRMPKKHGLRRPWKMELRFMSQIVLKVIRDSLN